MLFIEQKYLTFDPEVLKLFGTTLILNKLIVLYIWIILQQLGQEHTIYELYWYNVNLIALIFLYDNIMIDMIKS